MRAASLRAAALLAALALLAGRASAHDKDFAYSVDWALPYRGEHELESWSTYVPRSNDFVQLAKYEYGVTDHFTIEPAVELKKPNGENFKLEAAELEAYYNFRDFGYGKLLPGFEAEVERLVTGLDEDEGEGSRATATLRGLVSLYTQDGEDFTVNAVVSRRFSGDLGWEGALTAGYLRPLDFIPGFTPSRDLPVKAGLEMTQSLSGNHVTTLGPVLTWKMTESLHLVLGGQVALSHRSDSFDELRLILEWEF